MILLLILNNRSKEYLPFLVHEKSKSNQKRKNKTKMNLETWNQNINLICQGMAPFLNRGASGHTVIQRVNSFWPH